MSDERPQNPGKMAPVDPNHRPADRSTDAGLGMFERVNSLVGTPGIGTSQGMGGALEQDVAVGANLGVPGVGEVSDPGASGAESSPTRFTADEDRYWRENHGSRHYANPASNYEEYQPAYQYGTDSAHRYQGRKWDDVEGDLEHGWNQTKGSSGRAWQDVKEAVRDAWHRVERALPGDADHDGR